MTVRRRNTQRKHLGASSIPGGNPEQRDLPVRESNLETSSHNSPTGGTAKSQGSLPVSVVLEIIAREYNGGAQDESLCRVALQLAEESGLIDSYRARWDEAESNPASLRSTLLFDRNQCLELIHFHESRGRMEKLQQEKQKLAQIEGQLLLGGGTPTRITNEDLERLEDYIKESGF